MTPRIEDLQQISTWKTTNDDYDNGGMIITGGVKVELEKAVVEQGTAETGVKTRKCVQFAEHASVFKISSVDDVEERLAYWMTRGEYVQIRENCMREVRMALQQCSTTTSPNFRGLEHKTPQGLYRRFQNRQRATRTVLDEQKRQKESGFSDPSWIAAMYKEVCHRSVMEAKIVGMRDEVYLNHDSYVFSTSTIISGNNTTVAPKESSEVIQL